jgi:hypothetical protein
MLAPYSGVAYTSMSTPANHWPYGLQSLHVFSEPAPCWRAHSTNSCRLVEQTFRRLVRLPHSPACQSVLPGCGQLTRCSIQSPAVLQLTKKPAGQSCRHCPSSRIWVAASRRHAVEAGRVVARPGRGRFQGESFLKFLLSRHTDVPPSALGPARLFPCLLVGGPVGG